MATYTVRPIGNFGLVERGLAKIYKDSSDGGREEVSDYNNVMLPGASQSRRIFFDPEKRVYPIDLDRNTLNQIVRELRYIDPKTGKLIETADPQNEQDAFFCLEELTLEVPNSGVTLNDDTALGKFWLAAMRAEPKIFNINNNTDNPAIKRVQEFKVLTAGHTESEKKEQITEGKRAAAIFFANKDNYQWLVNICRGLDIEVADDAKIDALGDAIWLKITDEKDFKTRDQVRFIEKYLQLTDMPQNDLETQARIKKAIELGIIAKEGRRYSFDEQLLGTTPDKVCQFLSKFENTDTKGYILARLEEKTSGR